MSARTVLPKIFVSYAEEDIEDAEKLESLLRAQASQAGALIPKDWIYIARRSNHGGDDWRDKLYRELKNRPVFVLLISPACLESSWCLTQEAWVARQRDARFIPVVLDGRSPPRLAKPQTWFRRHTDWEKATIRASTETNFLLWCGREEVVHTNQSFPLTARHALPVGNESGRIVSPVRTDPERLWPLAVSQILEAIRAEDIREPGTVFACNQSSVKSSLSKSWEVAQGRPMMLLLMGDREDRLGEFWIHCLAQEARSGGVPDAARGEIPLDLALDWSQDQIASKVREVLSKSPDTGPCFFRWHVGSSGKPVKDRQLTAALKSIGAVLSDTNRRVPASRPGGVPYPPVVCSILVESNMDILDSLRSDLEQAVAGIHVETLPRLTAMDSEHVEAWVRDLAEPPATDDFKERAHELVKGLKKYSGAVRFRRLEELCRDHHLIHDQP